MTPPTLEFRTTDLSLHAHIAVAFRRDSFVASFGTLDRFGLPGGIGPDGYLK